MRPSTYNSWVMMRQRCRNPNVRDYKNYGGRGISIDPSWETYEQFLLDMGPCPPGLTLDRKDNSKGYSKENCRWASKTEQNQNTRTFIRPEKVATVSRLLAEGKTWIEVIALTNVSRTSIHRIVRKNRAAEVRGLDC